jgi:hypothetical protein
LAQRVARPSSGPSGTENNNNLIDQVNERCFE